MRPKHCFALKRSPYCLPASSAISCPKIWRNMSLCRFLTLKNCENEWRSEWKLLVPMIFFFASSRLKFLPTCLPYLGDDGVFLSSGNRRHSLCATNFSRSRSKPNSIKSLCIGTKRRAFLFFKILSLRPSSEDSLMSKIQIPSGS